jgi:hypothetical protein
VALLPASTDPETGAYTLKRWKVTKIGADGTIKEVTLRPDNKTLHPFVFAPTDGEVRVVSEYLETLG